jgi:hypothetical protein
MGTFDVLSRRRGADLTGCSAGYFQEIGPSRLHPKSLVSGSKQEYAGKALSFLLSQASVRFNAILQMSTFPVPDS